MFILEIQSIHSLSTLCCNVNLFGVHAYRCLYIFVYIYVYIYVHQRVYTQIFIHRDLI